MPVDNPQDRIDPDPPSDPPLSTPAIYRETDITRSARTLSPHLTEIVDTYDFSVGRRYGDHYQLRPVPVPPGRMVIAPASGAFEGFDLRNQWGILRSVVHYWTAGSYPAGGSNPTAAVGVVYRMGMAVGLVPEENRPTWEPVLKDHTTLDSRLNNGIGGQEPSFAKSARWLVDWGIAIPNDNTDRFAEDYPHRPVANAFIPTGGDHLVDQIFQAAHGSNNRAGGYERDYVSRANGADHVSTFLAPEDTYFASKVILNGVSSTSGLSGHNAEQRRAKGFFRDQCEFRRAKVLRPRDMLMIVTAPVAWETLGIPDPDDRIPDSAASYLQLEWLISDSFANLIPFL